MKQWFKNQQENWNRQDVWKISLLLGMTLVLITGVWYQKQRSASQTILQPKEETQASDTEISDTEISDTEIFDTEISDTEWSEMQETETADLNAALSEGQEEEQVIPVLPEVQLELNAGAAALLDADNKRVLYEKNGREHRAMASTTKIMTCILALELGNPEDIVSFSANAAAQPDVQMNGCEGEQYYLRDLLYSLMLESHNDTAVAIAEHIGGSVEGFAALMNEKARELGAYDTNFVTPNGLDAEGHYTTACDLGRIACYAIQNQEFLGIVQTPAYTFQELNGGRSVSLTNKDVFLTSYDGAMGIKTGFTGEAGYCFVGAARREGKTLVSVVLASGWPPHKTYKWEDTRTLMDYGMSQYEMQTILNSDYQLPVIPVREGKEQQETTLYFEKEISLFMREGETVQIVEQLPAELEAPVRKGEIAGIMDVCVNGALYESVVVYVGTDIDRIDYRYIFEKVIRQYFLIPEGDEKTEKINIA
ncbi:MAG: D-alanyl-D-alanine carboxypeptidase [Bacteroides sp.]|nr:D-alanyl-D-alanine carboxypeptidase [Bacteroides sp.]MCM1549297.1 D-alanyl-D-alanine carboxypeptidase [Clostridium sp.]